MQATGFFQALLSALLLLPTVAPAQTNLGVADYTGNEELLRPANLDEWIQTGAALGSEYNNEPFDPRNPGRIGVVQMEPAAYRYFMANGSYADGTMFLLSFYDAESKSDPQLPGFVQGALVAQEIHVLDKARFTEGRGFFLFSSPGQASSTKVADGSECVACHTEHGDLDGTFVQFYPAMRQKLGLAE
ncbi:MAG: cytochrome P460 family protein [Pseudomonadales bacterium]|nr:cytochrome P460 family protein [Pseudomonadales bacterium]